MTHQPFEIAIRTRPPPRALHAPCTLCMHGEPVNAVHDTRRRDNGDSSMHAYPSVPPPCFAVIVRMPASRRRLQIHTPTLARFRLGDGLAQLPRSFGRERSDRAYVRHVVAILPPHEHNRAVRSDRDLNLPRGDVAAESRKRRTDLFRAFDKRLIWFRHGEAGHHSTACALAAAPFDPSSASSRSKPATR